MSQHTEKFQNFERILTVDSKISINKTFGPNSGAVFPVWTQKYLTNPFVPNVIKFNHHAKFQQISLNGFHDGRVRDFGPEFVYD